MQSENFSRPFRLLSVQQGRPYIVWMSFWLLLVAIVFIVSIYFNWQHWGDIGAVNNDIHREFTVPLRLSRGEVIYKDFNFLYGPLPAYLNSWIIQIPFLKPFTILRSAALLLCFVNLFFLWLICRELKLSWVFGPVLFGIVGWKTPETLTNLTSFNNAYATLFATFGTWCAIRTLKSSGWPWIGLGVAAAGALLSKPEGVFILGLATIGACVCNRCFDAKLLYRYGLRWAAGFIFLAVPFVMFLFYKGLSWYNLTEGILQRRFQEKLSQGFISQYGYFFGINHVLVIVAGCTLVFLIFYLIKLYQARRHFAFWSILFAVGLAAIVLVRLGQLSRLLNDYQNLGDFFGGILGYWWYRQLPDGIPKKGFLIFWLSSFGGWLRPLFHIGALVIPFRVGGGMLLAVIFWFLMLPFLFQRVYPAVNRDSKWITNVFIKIGCVSILVFGFTGLYFSWNNQWKHPTVKFETPYGSFSTSSHLKSTQVGVAAIEWLRQNLQSEERIAALSSLPVELVLGWLPCTPITSTIGYQIYPGDSERIIEALEANRDVKYVLVNIADGGYHFGVQDYKLADYLDGKWRQVFRAGVSDSLSLNRLALLSPERKRDAGVEKAGIIIFERE